MQRFVFFLVAAFCVLTWATTSVAVDLLSIDDFIIAIDTDPARPDSNYPGGEDPLFAIDDDPGTKYLNFGGENTGVIVTPFFPTTVQSMSLTTANDAVERDPASFQLFGTNDVVTSADNSFGDQENWSLIAGGDLSLPDVRQDASTIVSFSNSTSYDAYRIVFPTLKDAGAANSMQIADIQLYTGTNATGSTVFNVANEVVAIGLDALPDANYPGGEGPDKLLDGVGIVPGTTSNSDYPAGESPQNAIDGTLAKYLNFAGTNSGFIVTPDSGPAPVKSFQLTTANDFDSRDPSAWEIYGTNEAVVSGDNSFGLQENWTLLDSGALALPTERDTLGPVVPVSNSTAYSSYKMIFPDLRGDNEGLMQIAEASFYSTSDGSGSDLLNAGDPIVAIDADVILGEETKYLNFGRENSGFIVTPGAGPSTLEGIQIVTANDAPSRDPKSYEIYGTNDPITSEDLSQGQEENWVLIQSGTLDDLQVPTDRLTEGTVIPITASEEYASYRVIFPTIRDATAEDANSLQIAGIQFFGEASGPVLDRDNDGDIDGNDFLALQRSNPELIGAWQGQAFAVAAAANNRAVPEPAAAMVMTICLGGLAMRRHAQRLH